MEGLEHKADSQSAFPTGNFHRGRLKEGQLKSFKNSTRILILSANSSQACQQSRGIPPSRILSMVVGEYYNACKLFACENEDEMKKNNTSLKKNNISPMVVGEYYNVACS